MLSTLRTKILTIVLSVLLTVIAVQALSLYIGNKRLQEAERSINSLQTELVDLRWDLEIKETAEQVSERVFTEMVKNIELFETRQDQIREEVSKNVEHTKQQGAIAGRSQSDIDADVAWIVGSGLLASYCDAVRTDPDCPSGR